MELETEIPIWFHGRVKWISNLTNRSSCSDVIQAILLSLSSSLDYHSSNINEDYQLFECWRGVERPLKGRCRLLKLWKSWAGESQNVILTLRSRQEQTIPTYILIRQQENKLNKLKRQIKKTDKQIEKLNCLSKLNENENHILTYLNISRSIIRLNNEIENKKRDISRLTTDIDNENNQDLFENDFKNILYDVNQTLISSRKLTQSSDELDQKINKIIEDIDQKQILLDELELDYALQDNIDLDSLDDKHDQNDQLFSLKPISLSPPPIIPIKTLTVPSRPTAIVEPSLSTLKSKDSLCKTKSSPLSFNNLHIEEKFSKKTNLHMSSLSSNRYNDNFQSFNNDHSNQMILSIHLKDQQLVTLV